MTKSLSHYSTYSKPYKRPLQENRPLKPILVPFSPVKGPGEALDIWAGAVATQQAAADSIIGFTVCQLTLAPESRANT